MLHVDCAAAQHLLGPFSSPFFGVKLLYNYGWIFAFKTTLSLLSSSVFVFLHGGDSVGYSGGWGGGEGGIGIVSIGEWNQSISQHELISQKMDEILFSKMHEVI